MFFRLLIRLLPLITLALAGADGAENPEMAAVRQADDTRISASIAADRAMLESVYSDQLTYSHASGRLDGKQSLVHAIAVGEVRYLKFSYEERRFIPVAPDIMLMAGRCRIKSVNHGLPVDDSLSFLAVWRKENGAWRFLAWHSSHVVAGKG